LHREKIPDNTGNLQNEDLEIEKELVSEGTDVKASLGKYDETPLHGAVWGRIPHKYILRFQTQNL